MFEKLYTYDIETYPNVFTAAFEHLETGRVWTFELSERKNEILQFTQMIEYLKQTGAYMVGFNNVNFDYPVIHAILTRECSQVTNALIYNKADNIINGDSKFSSVRDKEVIVPQIDLFKIHHFDNSAKSTSLKALEFFMEMDDIQDLPFEPGTDIPLEGLDDLVKYNVYDVTATSLFCKKSMKQIEFRKKLSDKHGRNFMHFSDVKIGVEVLIEEIEKHTPGSCYISGTRKPRQTVRHEIPLKDVILPMVNLEREEFKEIVTKLEAKTVDPEKTKGVFTNLSATIDNFTFDFGVGGLHGSVASQTVEADDNYLIVDLDVASYYPNLAIANNIYPEHLGESFCSIYESIYEQRKSHPKGSAENAMLKLALNGAYGNSNNKYSSLYDPKYTFTITINGQLLLAMLSEQMMKIPGLSMVQVNTDGITMRVPVGMKSQVDLVSEWWQALTGLVLEEALYSRMFIRDVNNYIAEYTDGKLKRKGAYEYETQAHQDPSSKVVAMVAEDALVNGANVWSSVYNHPHLHDFMLRAKIGRADRLFDSLGNRHQRITRMYASTGGVTLTKHSPPKDIEGSWKRKNGISDGIYQMVMSEVTNSTTGELDSIKTRWDARIHTANKSTHQNRTTSIIAGQNLTVCNTMDHEMDRNQLDFLYYIMEVQKLVEPVQS